ncbi:MAG TPA: hypothetical protein VFK43_23255 [Acidimicrobiales bacterium]|nr:hypothetical protein [Acidimicrobiales bacterium]
MAALVCPGGEPQRVVVDIDVVPGPFIEAVGERLLRVVTDELLKAGMEITRISVELHGRISAW